ncbi:MMPL family transporter [Neobacillus sp. PS3-40]|uniref:MMPL family transporter n=1 Tax=Neobacillus sp. PS3-40 TaxID=3070679 RepID=UPI0027E195D4|nr:MMPL family transporter [Neobacillus sp. PS3-40]WML43168.1 MMPL family transporter [Neobacillus sp. PS3-40]
MLQKLGDIAYQKRKLVLFLWILLILCFGFFALKLPTVLSGNGFEYQGEFNQTKKLLEKDFGIPKSSIILLFHKENSISQKEWDDYIQETFHKLHGFSTITPFDQEGMIKGNYAYGTLSFTKGPESLGKEINQLHKLLKNKKGLTVTMTGEPIMVEDLNEASQSDLAKAEMIGLPIALIVLILSFGGIVAAAIPLIIGIVSILITMGIVYFYSYEANLSIFILNIIPMIGLALSIDFALLFINRFKEELNNKVPLPEAIKTTVSTAGRSVIFSGLCVFIGLSGLLFIKIEIFQNVALGGMTVVFIAVLSANTFLPALLSIMGNNINKLSLFRIKDQQSSVWYRFAMYVMKRPILMALIAFAILLAGVIPAKDMILKIPGIDSLPEHYPSRLAYETFKDTFIPVEKREENRVIVVLQTKGNVLEEPNSEKIREVIQKLKKDPMVNTVISPFSIPEIQDPDQLFDPTFEESKELVPDLKTFVNKNKMHIEVFLKSEVHSSRARTWVRTWSKRHLGIKTSFGGHIKFEQEIFDEIYNKAPYGLLLIFITTFIILTVAFRSLLIPIKALLMNMLSLGCTFGIVVWIYQQGHLVNKPVDIALILPVFIFTLVFGLSMDYEVFLISRIQEIYINTGDNSTATISGLTYTSKIITSAAAIMIVVTGAFAFTGVMPIKQLGVGIAIAIFIDATVVRMVLVPALMKLLGDWNWWFFGFNKKKKPA